MEQATMDFTVVLPKTYPCYYLVYLLGSSMWHNELVCLTRLADQANRQSFN